MAYRFGNFGLLKEIVMFIIMAFINLLRSLSLLPVIAINFLAVMIWFIQHFFFAFGVLFYRFSYHIYDNPITNLGFVGCVKASHYLDMIIGFLEVAANFILQTFYSFDTENLRDSIERIITLRTFQGDYATRRHSEVLSNIAERRRQYAKASAEAADSEQAKTKADLAAKRSRKTQLGSISNS